MELLTWDNIGERVYETGTSKGVLFVQDTAGLHGAPKAWSGLVSVKQSPEGGDPTPQYADNIEYLSLSSAEKFKGSIDAFTYPKEFALCDGSAELGTSGVFVGQQERRRFGLVYSTIVGNDTMGNAYGEKIHIIYNAKVAPSERAYETVNDTPSAITFSWAFTTTPVSVVGIAGLTRPTSYVSIDSTKVSSAKFKSLQDLIYGTEAIAGKMPTLAEIITIIGPLPTTTTTTKA